MADHEEAGRGRPSDYEDVSVFTLSDEREQVLFSKQTECTFMWTNKAGEPVGVIMNYVWHEGRFWLTATRQRARIPAIERDPRVAIAITSRGTDIGISQSVTYKGTAIVHDDEETKAWFYPALAKRVMPNIAAVQRAFVALLDSERRVVLEVVPEKWITFDVNKMRADTSVAMARVAMPESVVRVAEQFGMDPEELIRRAVSIVGIDDPHGIRGPHKRVADALRRLLPR